MMSRLIQALGSSVGSVLGHSVCRDAFEGPALSRAYASIGIILAIFSAKGPILGGFITENYGWRDVFLFLAAFSTGLAILMIFFLPETHLVANRIPPALHDVFLRLLEDRKVWICSVDCRV